MHIKKIIYFLFNKFKFILFHNHIKCWITGFRRQQSMCINELHMCIFAPMYSSYCCSTMDVMIFTLLNACWNKNV